MKNKFSVMLLLGAIATLVIAAGNMYYGTFNGNLIGNATTSTTAGTATNLGGMTVLVLHTNGTATGYLATNSTAIANGNIFWNSYLAGTYGDIFNLAAVTFDMGTNKLDFSTNAESILGSGKYLTILQSERYVNADIFIQAGSNERFENFEVYQPPTNVTTVAEYPIGSILISTLTNLSFAHIRIIANSDLLSIACSTNSFFTEDDVSGTSYYDGLAVEPYAGTNINFRLSDCHVTINYDTNYNNSGYAHAFSLIGQSFGQTIATGLVYNSTFKINDVNGTPTNQEAVVRIAPSANDNGNASNSTIQLFIYDSQLSPSTNQIAYSILAQNNDYVTGKGANLYTNTSGVFIDTGSSWNPAISGTNGNIWVAVGGTNLVNATNWPVTNVQATNIVNLTNSSAAVSMVGEDSTGHLTTNAVPSGGVPIGGSITNVYSSFTNSATGEWGYEDTNGVRLVSNSVSGVWAWYGATNVIGGVGATTNYSINAQTGVITAIGSGLTGLNYIANSNGLGTNTVFYSSASNPAPLSVYGALNVTNGNASSGTADLVMGTGYQTGSSMGQRIIFTDWTSIFYTNAIIAGYGSTSRYGGVQVQTANGSSFVNQVIIGENSGNPHVAIGTGTPASGASGTDTLDVGGNIVASTTITATNGFASYATNTLTMGSTGITNTTQVLINIHQLTGTSMVETNNGKGGSLGTVTTGEFEQLQPNGFIIGTGCSAGWIQAQ